MNRKDFFKKSLIGLFGIFAVSKGIEKEKQHKSDTVENDMNVLYVDGKTVLNGEVFIKNSETGKYRKL